MKGTSIAVDLGGTLEDSWASKRAWFAARGVEIGSWPLSRREVVAITGGNVELYNMMVTEVYSDENVMARAPVSGAVDAVRTLARQFRILILTSRAEQQNGITFQWLRRHGFAELVTDVAYLGSEGNKLDWCQRAAVSVLIDDDDRHLEPVDECSSIIRIHFCPRESADGDRFLSVRRVRSWTDIVALLRTAPLP